MFISLLQNLYGPSFYWCLVVGAVNAVTVAYLFWAYLGNQIGLRAPYLKSRSLRRRYRPLESRFLAALGWSGIAALSVVLAPFSAWLMPFDAPELLARRGDTFSVLGGVWVVSPTSFFWWHAVLFVTAGVCGFETASLWPKPKPRRAGILKAVLASPSRPIGRDSAAMKDEVP